MTYQEYVNGLISKTNLNVMNVEDEEPEEIQSPKDEPDYYEEGIREPTVSEENQYDAAKEKGEI